MKFSIKKRREGIVSIGRQIGYVAIGVTREGEYSLVRTLGGGAYPRLHLYTKESGEELLFNLHLDQRKPSYEGTRAHGGEHDGPVVEKEVSRIQSILSQTNS